MNPYLHVFISCAIISGLGSLFHFIYEWSNCLSVVGIIGAVNESVWEHLKILLWPMFGWWMLAGPVRALPAAAAMYSASVLMVGVYAIMSEAAHYEQLWSDISLFVACAFVGQALGELVYQNYRSLEKYTVYAGTAVAALVSCMSVFSLAYTPTIVYLFQDREREFYGASVRVCDHSSDAVSGVNVSIS